MPQRGWIFGGALAVVAALAGLGIVAWLAHPAEHAFSGVVKAAPAPDFSLVDENGQAFQLSSLRGHWVLLTYGYTHCPDVCPTTLSTLRRVKEKLGNQANQLSVVFVSVDPARDTPDHLREYVHQFGADFKGLGGTAEEVVAAARAFGVKFSISTAQSASGYLVNHSAYVYLIDPQQQWRLTYPFGIPAEEMAADLQYLFASSTTEAQ